MDQSGAVWLEWRKKGLGSSDAPIIMGVSPYKTPFKLYVEKIQDGCAEEKSNFIFEKGHRLEAACRARIEIETMTDWSPGLFEREDKPYIRASMDAANKEIMEGKEFKYVGKEIFEKGVCPDHYFPQVMHQYLVTGFKRITMVLVTDHESLIDKKNGVEFVYKELEVPCDPEYCKKLFTALVKFREYNIDKRVPPELTDRDAMPIKDANLKALLKKYKANQDKINKVSHLEDENKALKEEIFALTNHPLMSYGKIRISAGERQGAIDYSSIPAIKQMKKDELEAFRKASSVVRKITC